MKPALHRRLVWLMLGLALCLPSAARAQSSAATPGEPPAPLIRSLEFRGNHALSELELKAPILTQAQTVWFGHVKPFLGIYRVGEAIERSAGLRPPGRTLDSLSWLPRQWARFGGLIKRRLGEPPRRFNPSLFAADRQALLDLYRLNGHFSIQIDTIQRPTAAGDWIRLRFDITEGEPTRIDSLRWVGVRRVDPDLHARLQRDTRLEIGQVYNTGRLYEERTRLIDLLQDNGYAYVTRDSIRVIADTSRHKTVGVTVFVRPGPKGVFGPTTVTFLDGKDDRLRHETITREFEYHEGDLYSRRDRLDTQVELLKLNVFEGVTIQVDSARNGPLTGDPVSVPIRVGLRMLPRRTIRPELIADNRGQNGLRLAGALTYSDRNLWRRAQSLRVTAGAGLQNAFGVLTGSAYFGDAQGLVELTQPYFLNSRIQAIYSGGASAQQIRRNGSERLLDSRQVTGRFRLLIQHNPTTASTLDALEIEAVNIRLNGLDLDTILAARRNPQAFKPHLNSTFRYTLRRNTANPITRLTGSSIEAGVEEAGALPYVLSTGWRGRVTLIDSIPYRNIIRGLPYSQYWRVRLDARRYIALGPMPDPATVAAGTDLSLPPSLAGRLDLGYMRPYGNAETTPLERRFFIGGPNSLRGWATNQAGPGPLEGEPSLAIGGQVRFESNLEYRFPVVNKLSGGLFLDLGNTWSTLHDVRLDELRLAGGYGLRYNTLIGPVRFDFGYRLYDPAEPDVSTRTLGLNVNRRWHLFRIRPFKIGAEPSKGGFQFHISIGHAF